MARILVEDNSGFVCIGVLVGQMYSVTLSSSTAGPATVACHVLLLSPLT